MNNYWIKYSYTSYFGNTGMKVEDALFVVNVSPEELIAYCNELDINCNNFKIESIVKL